MKPKPLRGSFRASAPPATVLVRQVEGRKMEYLKLLVELAKAVAWPAAVIAIGLMFKSDVRQV